MKKIAVLALVGFFVLVGPAWGADRDWDYTDLYQRDYDRGFFINLEGWWVSPGGLPNEYAVNDDVVQEITFNHEISPRISIGGSFGERVGTFTLTYFEYSESAKDYTESQIPGEVYSTVFRPEIGAQDWAMGNEDLEIRTLDLAWTKGFGQTRKFDGWWTVGLRYWNMEDRLTASFSGGEYWDGRAEAEAFGIRAGIGGTYWFAPRFGLVGGLYGAFLRGDSESSIETNVNRQRYEDDDKTFAQLEAELYVLWRAVAGLNFTLGYRFADYMNAIDFPGGPGGEEDIRVDGPFVGIGFIFGAAKTDTDGDGVLDYLDDCPGTVRGCTVDEHGCPSDFDEDGVCDGLDRCPGTNFGCRVDANGCAIDTDGDTICDGLDLCPDTPWGCRVDKKGCPRDSDGDGVCDGLDQCPNTARGARVDKVGCPIDSDGDTVPDNIDRCPNTPKGVKVNEWGCEVELVFQNIQFEFDKFELMGRYQAVLNKVAKALADNSKMALRLHGHTDWVGTEEYNLELSQKRADAVSNYLVKKRVKAKRLETVGHGECCPVAPNTTDEGRFKNRRVEFERIR